MYLKSIEINGFKSFANKIIFEFPHGITGIVGPNGSGKSNIGDAVRWVLGEQSAKQLRGSRMEDVIFSGTESRKPLGFAYVSITFENTDRKIKLDYDEIKVARRVYRSGESEYLINGSVCRRRQIVELFYDTGIGKDGYSIIGQGQVEKILSGRLEDSRELFDEAAGIAKYKKDRNVTEKTLEKAREDLERVTDILRELEKQVGPLEHQSKKAKQYLKLRDREKEIDIQLFLRDYSDAEKEKTRGENNLLITQEQLTSIREDYEQKKRLNSNILKKAENFSDMAEKQEQDMARLREEDNAIEKSMLEIRHEMEKNQLLEEQCHSNLSQASQDISLRKQQIEEEKKKISSKKTILSDCEDAIKLLEVDREKLSDQLSILEMMKEKEQEQIMSHLTDTTNLKEKLSRVKTLEEQLNIRNAEYNSRYLALRTEMSDYHRKAEDLKQEISRTTGEKNQLDAIYDSSQKKLSETQASIERLQERMEKNNQSYLRNRSQYETLSNLTERYEGYQRSIQHVMEQKKNHPDLIGVVADILSMDHRYEIAIEIALGGALQNIVTENESVAKKMIRFLKENRFGRATFLPLTSIRKRNISINPSILEEEGVIGIASDLVRTEDRFRNLIISLLGRTIVVENIDNALYLARKYNFSLRIVTLEGELINPGGSITGGAFRNNSNLLGRHREMEECKEAMEKARMIYQESKKALVLLQAELSGISRQASLEKEKSDEALFHLNELSKQLPLMEEKEKELQERLDHLRKEHELIKAQIAEVEVQKKSLSKNQASNEKISEENQGNISDLDMQIQKVTDDSRKVHASYNELILKQSQTKQVISFAEQTIRRLDDEIASLEDSIYEYKLQCNALLLENKNSQDKLNQQKFLKEDSHKKISSLETVMEKLKEDRRKITDELSNSYKDLEASGEQLRALEKEETRLSSRLERLSNDMDSLSDYMWENYELTYHYARSMMMDQLSQAEIQDWRKEKKTVRQNIKALGNVNVGAIEEFKEVGERYHFVSEQYDDIKETEEKLLTLIDEFNTKMRAQFREKFKDIQVMFGKVFCDLFEGGTASLEIIDEANILESGIRIIAQPPGKKLQNILLLSGGERALTAIALLFAIQNLKPSPFCLLDEIEAALDDANIVRFSKYLKTLSKDTQFIVITHRRGTMNAADVLYGITMQEKGISTLISVDLIDKGLK